MDISLVVAAAENNVIGRDGDMPWRLSTDLKRFKALTLGKPMIMGRKTFDSIGKTLPGRTTIVVTRDKEWQAEGVVPVSSLPLALELAQQIADSSGVDEVCIVGGGEIYKQALADATVVHLTRVHAQPDGDTVFPDLSTEDWQETHREVIPAGEKDSAETTYLVYRRR